MSDAVTLRQRAEEAFTRKHLEPVSIRSESEILKFVHELEVHQIELEMVNEELLIQNSEKEKREEELLVLNKKLSSNLSLLKSNKKLKLLVEERKERAGELIVANKALVFESKEKEKRAAELFIANKELLFQNNEKTQRAQELIIANIELLFQNDEKATRAAELVIANKELLLLNDEKAKLAVELVLANKELLFQNDEKTLRADELILANIELLFQNDEKEKRAAELSVANILIAFQRDRLEEIASLVPGVVYQYRLRPDGTSCFPYASEAIKVIYRVTPEEVREDATKVFANLHPDDYEGVMASIHVSAKELTPWQQEYRVKFEDGTIRSLFGNALPRLEEDGSVLWHGFITDITERKRSVDELRQSEERFRIVVEQSPMANVVHSNGIILYANPAAVEMFGGASLQDLAGTSIWDRIHPDFHSIVLERVRKGVEEGTGAPLMQFRYFRLDGTIFDAEAQGTTISYDGVPCIHAVMRDVTERNRMENLLKENNSRLAIAMQMAKMAWWEMDVLTGKVNFDSRKVEMLGYSPENFRHYSDFTDLLHPDDQDKAMNAMRGHFTGLFDRYKVEYRILTQSGEYKWFYDNGSIDKRDDKGKPLHISGFVIDITERKLAENFLRESEARYGSMISNISDVIAIMDADGFKKYESPNMRKIFGWLPEDNVGRSAFSFVHPDDIQNVQKVFYAMLGEDNSVKTFEFRYECKDGSYKPVELIASNLLNDPLINGVMVSFRDITERKKAIEELQESRQRYSSMISNISDVIGIMGADGLMKYKSANIEKYFGWIPEERIGTSGFSTIHPDDIEQVQRVFYSLLGEDKSVKTLEFRYECKDGSYKPIELTAANLLNDPVINGVLLNYRDISDRKAIEEEKLKADITIRTLSLAINQSPVTLVITDLTGNIELVNPRFTETTGYPAEEVIGKNPRILQAGDQKVTDYKDLWDTILSGRNWYGIFHNKKKSGELFWESAVISPVKDQYGIITHFLCVKEDITSRLKSEQELKDKNEELQKVNAEKDKFFSIIAHDLRGPLGGFMGLTEMMANEDQYFTEIEKKEMTLDLSRSARNTFKLLENLLEWSQMDRGLTEFKPQKLDLKDVVNECITILAEPARGKAIGLVANIPCELIVFADNNMVQTVIRNLLSNAIKFTPKGGQVTISAIPAENNMIVISVKDTGIGMSEKMRNDLFRIDASTKRPGTDGEQSTGLGLLLCREFVEKQGGELGVESEQFKGTVFSFTIPSIKQMGNEMAGLKVELREKSVVKINNINILIAEDDEISARLILAIVKEFSGGVFRVKTGLEAVEFCRNNPQTNLVLMDIAMPFMDGYDATKLIRQFNKEVVIIAQTTFAMTADREKALASGCNDFITKPFVKNDVVKLIGKHIKHSTLSGL